MNTKSRDYIKDYSIVNGNLIVTYGTNEKSKPLSLSDLESVKNKIREEIKDLKEEDTKLKRNYNKYRLYAALCILTSVLSLGAGTIISFGSAAVIKAIGIVMAASGSGALFKRNYDKAKETKQILEKGEAREEASILNRILIKKDVPNNIKTINHKKTFDDEIELEHSLKEDKGISYVKKSA